MKFTIPRDQDLIEIMLEGGQSFCAKNQQKWRDPEYCPDLDSNFRNRQVARWEYASRRCQQLAIYLKEVIDGAPKRSDYVRFADRARS